jgi:hypothetical protein
MTNFAKQSTATLIDRYIYDVGRRLPAKNREDVQMELRSALQDALDERGIDASNPAHEERVVELLREFGEPHKVAAGYGVRRFIVGPELQPSYWLVLRIAAFGVTVGQIVRLIVAASQGEPISIGDTVGGFVGAYLTGFAIVSLIFAILEYFLPDLNLPLDESFDFVRAKNYGTPNQGWDPRTLPHIMLDYDKINVFEIVVELFFETAFIYVINAFSGWNLPELITSDNEGAEVVAQLIAVVQPFIPAFTGLAIATIAIRLFLLVRGRWEPWTRWAEIVTYAGSAVVMWLILAAAPYTGIELVDNIARLSVGISLLICVIYTLSMLYRVLRPNDILPWDGENLEREIEELGRKGEAFGKAVDAKFRKQGKG